MSFPFVLSMSVKFDSHTDVLITLLQALLSLSQFLVVSHITV